MSVFISLSQILGLKMFVYNFYRFVCPKTHTFSLANEIKQFQDAIKYGEEHSNKKADFSSLQQFLRNPLLEDSSVTTEEQTSRRAQHYTFFASNVDRKRPVSSETENVPEKLSSSLTI